MLHGCNIFRLRAKWSRSKRKFTRSSVITPLEIRSDDTPVKINQYLIAHLHIARVWAHGLVDELEWFLQSLRGELPPRKKPKKDFVTHYIFLPKDKYFPALAALTTRLGVRV